MKLFESHNIIIMADFGSSPTMHRGLHSSYPSSNDLFASVMTAACTCLMGVFHLKNEVLRQDFFWDFHEGGGGGGGANQQS